MRLDRATGLLSRLKIFDRDTRRPVPFVLNQNQRRTVEMLKQQEEEGKGLRWIVLKSRRVGMSSLASGLMVPHCQSLPGATALIVAHLASTSTGIFSVPKYLARQVRDRFMPEITILGERLIFPHAGGEHSTLSIHTAGSLAGGRGLTLTALLLSEAAYFPSIAPFTALITSVSKAPESMICIESTANGRELEGEEFYNYWQSAQEGRSEFIPVFLSWLDDAGCVADAELAEGAPDDEEERELMDPEGPYRATPAQIAWRRLTIETACNGYLDRFHQEFPVNPEQSFIASGDPAFDAVEMRIVEREVQEPKRRCQIASNGDIVEGGKKAPLLVWEEPRAGVYYFIGADAARGEGDGDFTAFCVWAGDTGELVARFAERIDPTTLAVLLDAVGRHYHDAMIAVELTGNLGWSAQRLLRDEFHYPNLYRWRGKDDRAKRKTGGNPALGWETTYRTRQMLYESFRFGIRSGRMHVRDQALKAQMSLATQKSDGRWEVKRGHDDILLAAMIGWIAREQNYHGGTLAEAWNREPEELGGVAYVPALDNAAVAIAMAKDEIPGLEGI